MGSNKNTADFEILFFKKITPKHTDFIKNNIYSQVEESLDK